MYVSGHRLHESDGTAVPFMPSPNHGDGLEPRYLVIHYTASLTLHAVVDWFLDPAARASAHVIIDRDGRIVQMVPFDRRAWHAGRSRWDGLEGLNAYSVGIELVNAGALERTRGGRWVAWTGDPVPEHDIVVARHRSESVDRAWHAFTLIQIQRALAIAKTLHRCYGFRDVLGHDDIAPGRKIDPGPAFPMARFASAVLGEGPGFQQASDIAGERPDPLRPGYLRRDEAAPGRLARSPIESPTDVPLDCPFDRRLQVSTSRPSIRARSSAAVR